MVTSEQNALKTGKRPVLYNLFIQQQVMDGAVKYMVLNEIADQEFLEDMLQDLVALFDANCFKYTFTSLNKIKQLIMKIPSPKKRVSFFPDTNWLSTMAQHMESKCIGEETFAVENLILYLGWQYPQEFIASAKKAGYPVMQKLTAIEAAATWADSSTNVSNAWCIAKHLEHATGGHLCIPKAQVQKLGTVFLEPTYGQINCLDGTSVDFWTRAVCTAIATEVECLAEKGGFDDVQIVLTSAIHYHLQTHP